MYKHNSKQLEFEDFALPFSGGLRSDNRWIKIAKFIPWDEFEFRNNMEKEKRKKIKEEFLNLILGRKYR